MGWHFAVGPVADVRSFRCLREGVWLWPPRWDKCLYPDMVPMLLFRLVPDFLFIRRVLERVDVDRAESLLIPLQE